MVKIIILNFCLITLYLSSCSNGQKKIAVINKTSKKEFCDVDLIYKGLEVGKANSLNDDEILITVQDNINISDTLILSYGLTGIPIITIVENDSKRVGSPICIEEKNFNVDHLTELEEMQCEIVLDTIFDLDSLKNYVDSVMNKVPTAHTMRFRNKAAPILDPLLPHD